MTSKTVFKVNLPAMWFKFIVNYLTENTGVTLYILYGIWELNGTSTSVESCHTFTAHWMIKQYSLTWEYITKNIPKVWNRDSNQTIGLVLTKFSNNLQKTQNPEFIDGQNL